MICSIPPNRRAYMKRLTNIFSLIVLLLTLSHNVSAGTTIQAQDVIIINKVTHRVNRPLMFQIDSTSYLSLKEKLDFNSSTFSWNFRGHVATFEVRGNELFLNSIETSKVHTDFKGLLDKYNRKEGIFASWVSSTIICGTGECIYVEPDGLLGVYENETELVIEAGVIVSSRTYTNMVRNVPGTVTFDDIRNLIPKEFRHDNFPDLKGRVTVRINATKFNEEGKITDWSVTIYSGGKNLSERQIQKITAEVKRVLFLYDFRTFRRDGIWYWRSVRNDSINWPLIFN